MSLRVVTPQRLMFVLVLVISLHVCESKRQSKHKENGSFLPDINLWETLNKYITRVIKPDTLFLESGKRTIDKVVKYLHQKLHPALQSCLKDVLPPGELKKVNINKIVKGGSLGKSTAVKNKSDIDLVIFLNGIETVSKLRDVMPNILECLEGLLDTLVNDGQQPWARRFRHLYKSKFAVPIELETMNDLDEKDTREIDLLPAVDIIKSVGSIKKIYEEMDSVDDNLRRYFSASLSPLQLKFVQEATASAKVKDLIQFMKHWAKVNDVPVRSYFLELVVIHVQREHPERDFDIDERCKDVFRVLARCDGLKIVFNNNYDVTLYRNAKTNEVPHVLCPSNPYMNTAPNVHNAKIVSRLAKEALDYLDSTN
ncbi:2'-5'-oligoadenylate synthase 1A-like [Gigantopelta aegis]|uniref:2'-5'-oligoadenylate synthase 1A-like n=1 Tax=Gigantopelta aegis TaxID=1735272 RepID=UPI001B88CE62|nr:2'-5'-oligoadenylate synthase 1A-like [Gigantopelta aegis]